MYNRRREWVFLILAGIFLGSLTMLNILGITRFIDLSSWIGIPEGSDLTFALAIGVLPYPITFLCTDFISEIFGKRRANQVVWVGLILNIWVLIVLWIGGVLDQPEELLPDGTLPLQLESGVPVAPHGYAFYEVRKAAFGATFASMLAYLTAQFIDVHVFHFLKKKTQGKKLWLRNNVSTMTSQLVDSTAVILITHYFTNGLLLKEGVPLAYQLLMYIVSAYLFKLFFALFDTIPFYIGVKYLRRYLNIQDELGD